VVPIKSDSEHYPPEGKLRVYRSRTGGNAWEALTNGLPQENCYVNIFRNAFSNDTLDSCGIYFGTTGGQSMPQRMRANIGRPSCAIYRQCCRGGPDTAMIRVILPTIWGRSPELAAKCRSRWKVLRPSAR